MALLCNLLLSESFRMAKRARLFDDGIFCVDYTTVYYSGRQGEYTLKVMQEAKGKKKKRRGFMYGVSCVVRPGNRYFTGVMPYKKGDGVDKTVGYLMERMLAEFSLSMFDKGFINCDAFQRLENEDKDYVLPFKRNKQLDQAWGGVDVLIEYRLRKHGGGGKLVSILLMKDEEKECGYRAFVFPLGISMEEAKKRADLYRLRWQQEIGFKCRNKVRAWTKSPSTSYRLILFTISLLVSNLWFFLKQTGNRIRQTSFRLHFFCTVLTAQVEIGDKQTVFGTKIKKVDNPFS